MSPNALFGLCIILLLCIIPVTAESPTPFPTVYQPPDNECSAPQYTLPNDWLIDPLTTTTRLDEDTNLFWIKLFEPSSPRTQRLLFNVSTNYAFESRYNHILFTTDIYGNFSIDSSYYLTQINPKFFITSHDQYIGVSLDNGTIRFTATSCDGSSGIPSTSIPSDTTSISYILGSNENGNTSLSYSHIRIAIQSNRSALTTLVVVQLDQYQSTCTYNTIFAGAIVFAAASATNDDYYRFRGIHFGFCSTELNTAPNIYCEEDEFIASVLLWDGSTTPSFAYQNITINGTMQPFHGLFKKEGQNYLQRTVSNVTPSQLITIGFTFLAIKMGPRNRRYAFLSGSDEESLVESKVFLFNTTHCPNQVNHTTISGTSIDGSLDESSLICLEHYAVNVTSSSETLLLRFETADAGQSDVYYGFNHLCIEETIPSASTYTTLAPTPAPTDLDYSGCPLYESKLSDYTSLNGTTIRNARATNHGVYTYAFKQSPMKTSEWLLSAPTHVMMDGASWSSITVNVDIVSGCQGPIIVIKDATQFVSIRLTPQTVGFYPECDALIASVPPSSIHETYPDPAQNITYDTNNLIWQQGFEVNTDAEVVLVSNRVAETTTAYVQRTLRNSSRLFSFGCRWNGTLFGALDVLFGASTNQSCQISSIQTTYCDVEWNYPLDFCDSTQHIASWTANKTTTIAQNVVHGTFDETVSSVNTSYFNVPPHELVDVDTTVYLSATTNTIAFKVNGHVVANYAGHCLTNYTDNYCALPAMLHNMNHTSGHLNLSIEVEVISGSTAFTWAVAGLCIDQSFRITKSPTPAPTSNPTLPTNAPTDAPTQPPTKTPSSSPTQPPTRSPSFSPSQPPTNAPTQPPTDAPSGSPTQPPSNAPSSPPTIAPSGSPTQPPSGSPSQPPTVAPSGSPTQPPSQSPSFSPSSAPSGSPTQPPTRSPSFSPTNAPSDSPTQPPSRAPSDAPSQYPSRSPSFSPTQPPTDSPTQPPSKHPSFSPSSAPSGSPTQPPSTAPSISPTLVPSASPTQPPTNTPSDAPSSSPSNSPTQPPTKSPSVTPSSSPTQPPSRSPTQPPSNAPSQYPSRSPSFSPTQPPTNSPTQTPSKYPSFSPSSTPSASPTQPPTNTPSDAPSSSPSNSPTQPPTKAPSVTPSSSPTQPPSRSPSAVPSIVPSSAPTQPPSRSPTQPPSTAPSGFPSATPTVAPSRSPTQPPSTSPSQPPTNAPSDAPSNAPTMLPTAAPIASNEEKSQLRLNRTHGFCAFSCSECLEQIDIIGTRRLWAMTFRERNTSLCECPQTTAIAANTDNTTIDIALTNPRYSLKMEKYVMQQEQFGIRVNVFHWMNRASNCSISYYVNQNQFFGVEAQNILTITFTICDLNDDALTPAAIREAEVAFKTDFASLFSVSVAQVTASVEIGSFCQNNRRRRLLQKGNDQEVTVVIVFADAEDANAAEENACGEAMELVEDADEDSCSVETQSASQLAAQAQTEKEIILGLTWWETTLVVVGMVLCFVVICVGFYYYESYKKNKQETTLNIKLNHTGDTMGGAVARAPIIHTVVHSEEGLGLEMTKPETEEPLPPKTALSQTNVSTVLLPQQHVRGGQSIEIDIIHGNSSSSGQLPTTNIPMTNTQETHGTAYHDYRIVTANDGNSCIAHDYEDINYLNQIADNTVLFTKEYKSEQEMIEEVIHSGKANEILPQDVEMEKQIGTGQFGAVFRAAWEGNVVVVKHLNSDAKQSDDDDDEKLRKQKLARAKEMKAEIILASSIPTHNNLVEIYGYIRSPFGVVMSYMPGDSVQKHVYRCYKQEKAEIPRILELLIILGKAASGLKFLHEYGLVHRDIACRNILLGKIHNNRIETSTEVRISDFGLTRELANKSSDDFIQKTQSTFGPLKWMAPESIKAKEYSKKSDVYMFGITMWEIFYGREPYTDMTAVNVAINVVTKQNRPEIKVDAVQYEHTEMPDGYQYVMENCWHQKPQKRPTFTQILTLLSKVATNPVRRAP
eukprot:582072_1